jgi:hypothetical protein
VQRVLDQVVEHDRDVLVGGVGNRVAVALVHEILASLIGVRAPALLSAPRRVGERDSRTRRGISALAGERQLGAEQAREPLELELGGGEVLVDFGATPVARGLDAEAQSGQRSSQLVGGVGHELPLGR